MANIEQRLSPEVAFSDDDQIRGKNKLNVLKARFLPPENKAERVTHALKALKEAVMPSTLDVQTVKYIAEDVSLEGL